MFVHNRKIINIFNFLLYIYFRKKKFVQVVCMCVKKDTRALINGRRTFFHPSFGFSISVPVYPRLLQSPIAIFSTSSALAVKVAEIYRSVCLLRSLLVR